MDKIVYVNTNYAIDGCRNYALEANGISELGQISEIGGLILGSQISCLMKIIIRL